MERLQVGAVSDTLQGRLSSGKNCPSMHNRLSGSARISRYSLLYRHADRRSHLMHGCTQVDFGSDLRGDGLYQIYLNDFLCHEINWVQRRV